MTDKGKEDGGSDQSFEDFKADRDKEVEKENEGGAAEIMEGWKGTGWEKHIPDDKDDEEKK